MSRLPYLTPAELTDRQEGLYAAIISSPRGNPQRPGGGLARDDGALVGPFNAMLHAPEVGDLVQQLGAALRYQNSIPRHLIELAIIITAREWSAQFEWWAHARMAGEAGIDASIIAAIQARETPEFAKPDEATVYRFCRELLDTRRVSDETYAALEATVGAQGVVELTALQGYYGLISMLLNVVQVPLPEGVEEPLAL